MVLADRNSAGIENELQRFVDVLNHQIDAGIELPDTPSRAHSTTFLARGFDSRRLHHFHRKAQVLCRATRANPFAPQAQMIVA